MIGYRAEYLVLYYYRQGEHVTEYVICRMLHSTMLALAILT